MTDAAASRAMPLRDAVAHDRAKIVNPDALALYGGVRSAAPVLVVLAAGKGTRFGQDPKCIARVHGLPLARHSVDAFRRFCPAPVLCLVGYRASEVAAALGADNVYVRSDNPTGGTAFAAYEAFCVSDLADRNPLLIVTMGDRIVTPAIFRRLADTHQAGPREADVTLLTALYEPPRNAGKGRVIRDGRGRVERIVEQRDLDALADGALRQRLNDLAEGNCPLYAVRALTLRRHLEALENRNAQGQYYLTDVIEAVAREGGDVRSLTVCPADPEYDLLCADVTRTLDLALLEGVLDVSRTLLFPGEEAVAEAARAIAADRPAAQTASIARQIETLHAAAVGEKLQFRHDEPVGIGVSGGRLRIAFMHPDMARFFGPAWQMPIGAGDASGDEQIAVLVQPADDCRIHLHPTNPRFRENTDFIPSDNEAMYPGEDVSDWRTYEQFGTRMSETILLSLGYFSDDEIRRRRETGLPLPPTSLWVSASMRRPFSLVGNAIASMRTLRRGNLGARVQRYLGRDAFRGLRWVATGSIPQGGFSSSSAVTVATKNALNALYDLGVPGDLLVHLACQAEYGTGVRAGSLDQATEQKGRAGEGTLISSNPRDNYCVLGTYRVPSSRFRVIFPYSVERDRAAAAWSLGAIAESPAPGRLTAAEWRKLTGKAAEIAAVLVRLPLDTDFFKAVEGELLSSGRLSPERRRWIASILLRLPLLTTHDGLRDAVGSSREWYLEELIRVERLDATAASRKADADLALLFAGWRDPVLRRAGAGGGTTEECGVPLRAIVAYLFAEVAKNFRLIREPEDWIACVTRSQRGDRWFEIEPARLPAREAMESDLDWEAGTAGPARLERWMERCGARPCDYNRGLDAASLSAPEPPAFEDLAGSSFFRGLALIDLAEAMLKRAFGEDAVAVRVNAAGQGDYFQLHVDTEKAEVEDVKRFVRLAFYRRFGIQPDPEFVELRPGGPAAGVRLSRFDDLPRLAQRLRAAASPAAGGAAPLPRGGA
jgi:GTP:adenosylcobinamide-phosphate guanylyltransferase